MSPKRPGKTIVILALTLVSALFLLSKSSLSALIAAPILSVAQLSALLGLSLFSFSFILASRTMMIEEAFGGLDRAYRFHHKAGVWSFNLLLVHLAAILISYGLLTSSIAADIFGNLAYLMGLIAFVLMAVIIITIIYSKIKYRNFTLIQKFFAIPYGFGIYHILIVNSDISRYAPLRLFMFALVALGGLAWAYREFLYARLAPQASYLIKSIEDKKADITEITLAPKDKGRALKFKPGQFAYFSFRSRKISSEQHPFSFASAPGNDELVFAAKRLGDFTLTLKDAAPGDEVVAYGPYGKFFDGFDADADNIFIAGGIGITPFLSELRRDARRKNTMLFYSTRSEDDCAYGDELFALSSHPSSFRYHFHDSNRRGYLTTDIIEKRAGGLAGKTLYLCGPATMIRSIAQGLASRQVPAEKIVFEEFSY